MNQSLSSKAQPKLTDHFPFDRAGGVLLHPTSLPSEHGIGDIGKPTIQFLKLLGKHNITLWQILPLGPTGYGNSPYQSFSAFAGNPFLISLEELVELNLLEEVEPRETFRDDRVVYEEVIPHKWNFLRAAYQTFAGSTTHEKLKRKFGTFQKIQNFWLDDYALFMALKDEFGGHAWSNWPEEYRDRQGATVHEWQEDHEDRITFHKFVQFVFFTQWAAVRKMARRQGVWIIGDIPIFVSYDSADVWANKELYYLDEEGKPTYIAGVPPDYFSDTGQRWGNPLYRWDILEQDGFNWWVERFSHTLSMVDLVRVDHFRGFEAYWQIPAKEETAIKGKWMPGPRDKIFKSVLDQLGNLPIIAEDLGVITPEVEVLRDRFGFPSMKVLQFAFGEDEYAETKFLPHNFGSHCIAYTGTHDNDTAIGWFEAQPKKVQKMVLGYIGGRRKDFNKQFIRTVFQSVARMAVVPAQDLLELGSEARMNFPGKPSGNWEWRITRADLRRKAFSEIGKMCRLYERS